MRLFAVLLGCALCAPAAACPPPWPERPWAEVEALQQAPRAASLEGWQMPEGTIAFTRDGRFVIAPTGADGGDVAMFGGYRLEGPWIDFTIQGLARNLANLPADERAQAEAALEEMLAAEANAEAAPAAGTVATAESHAAPPLEGDLMPGDGRHDELGRTERLLRLAYGGGEVLLRESALVRAGNEWDGQARLELQAVAWRFPAASVRLREQMPSVVLTDPRQAGLPFDVARLFAREPVEARVTALVEAPAALDWQGGYTFAHVRLDRGAKAGLYPGMQLRGLPPDDHIAGEVVALRDEQALVQVMLERFAPDDAPALPTPGLRMTSRAAAPVDGTVAVRATVVGVEPATTPALAGDQGFVWLELVLEGAAGLRPGDRLASDSHHALGEGQVTRVAGNRAHVRWRAPPYALDAARLPVEGAALVTAAWAARAASTPE
jgi:hypothetical protein